MESAGQEKWESVRVRFLEGGRAQKTPSAIYLKGRWRDVHLLAEALHSSLNPAAFYERRFWVQTSEGKIHILRSLPKGTWQIRTFYRDLGARGPSC